MKIPAYIFILLTALFTVQPLIMMTAKKHSETCVPPANTCSKSCNKNNQEQKTENKNCDATTRCNASSCCFTCHYLPTDQPLYKSFWSTSNIGLNPYYTESPVSGYSTDCWQPPEFLFV